MTTLRIATMDDFDRLDQMVAAYHQLGGIKTSNDRRKSALEPLLQGSPYGVVYMIGPASSPVGYLAVTFNWSIEFGGLEAILDEIYIRETVRGRGMGRDAVAKVCTMLMQNNVRSMSLEVDHKNTRAVKFYQSLGFKLRDSYGYMSATF